MIRLLVVPFFLLSSVVSAAAITFDWTPSVENDGTRFVLSIIPRGGSVTATDAHLVWVIPPVATDLPEVTPINSYPGWSAVRTGSGIDWEGPGVTRPEDAGLGTVVNFVFGFTLPKADNNLKFNFWLTDPNGPIEGSGRTFSYRNGSISLVPAPMPILLMLSAVALLGVRCRFGAGHSGCACKHLRA